MDKPDVSATPDPSMEDILASIRRILSEDEASETSEAEPPHAPVPQAAPEPAPAHAAHETHTAQAEQDEILDLDEAMIVPPEPDLHAVEHMPDAPKGDYDASHELGSLMLSLHEPETHEPETDEPETHEAASHEPAFEPHHAPAAFDDDAAEPPGAGHEPAPGHAFPDEPPAEHETEPMDTHAALFSAPPADASAANGAFSPGLVAPEAAAGVSASVGSLVRRLASERTTQTHRGGPTIEDMVREELRPMLKAWLDTHLPPLVERLVATEIERVVSRATF